MPERAHLRVQHLRRLTDRTGLSRGSTQGESGGLSGYDTLDNARALRLSTRLASMGLHDDASGWASIYLQFLFQAFRAGQGFSARRECLGDWSNDMLPPYELAQTAQALAAASNGSVPGVSTERADNLWNQILPDLAAIRCARTAACWIMAIAERPPAEQRRLEDAVDRLATWLVEHCYYSIRSSEWEWFDEHVLPFDMCLPHGLWAAHTILGESRYAGVAATATDFLCTHLFEDGVFSPIGTRGGWPRHCTRALFDQMPADVAAAAELLACAADISGRSDYADYARQVQKWFTGNNINNICMLDETTGGVYDALTENGHESGQGATAIVSYLLSAVAVRSLQQTAPAEAEMNAH